MIKVNFGEGKIKGKILKEVFLKYVDGIVSHYNFEINKNVSNVNAVLQHLKWSHNETLTLRVAKYGFHYQMYIIS